MRRSQPRDPTSRKCPPQTRTHQITPLLPTPRMGMGVHQKSPRPIPMPTLQICPFLIVLEEKKLIFEKKSWKTQVNRVDFRHSVLCVWEIYALEKCSVLHFSPWGIQNINFLYTQHGMFKLNCRWSETFERSDWSKRKKIQGQLGQACCISYQSSEKITLSNRVSCS